MPTGGVITTPGDGYQYHTFTSSGTFDPQGLLYYEWIAGGAGAGGGTPGTGGLSRTAGGGSAGRLAWGAIMSAATVTVTIGNAGAAGSANASGQNGGTTTLQGALNISLPGGRGGACNSGGNAQGVSGELASGAQHAGFRGVTTAFNGQNGGLGYNSGATNGAYGAGGGAGEDGDGGDADTIPNAGARAGDGGPGIQWLDGLWYGEGGSGGAEDNGGAANYLGGVSPNGAGGNGAQVTSNGNTFISSTPATAGVRASGGGGGAGRPGVTGGQNGAAGAPGIFVVRWRLPGAQPATISAPVTMPAVTVLADTYTVVPATIAATVALPPVTKGFGYEVAAPLIARSFAVNAPSVQAPITASPAVIARSIAMPAVTASGATVVASERLIFPIKIGGSVSPRLFSYGAYDTEGGPPKYTAVVLGPGGTPRICALDQAVIGKMSWVLNGTGTVPITLPADDSKASSLVTAKREVQIWRGADLLWQGVIVRARGDEVTVTYQCVDLGWYFAHRNVGTPETNAILNGSFENGFENWGVPAFDPAEPGDLRHTDNWDVEIVDSPAIIGSKSLHIWGNDVIGAGAGVMQTFVWDVDPSQSPEGDTWYLVAWCYIPSSTYVRPRIRNYSDQGASGGLGIIFQRSSTTETSTIFTPGIGEQTFPKQLEVINLAVDDTVPKDTWIRMQAPLTVPVSDDPEYVSVQCFGPVGDIYWDGISMVRNEALMFNNVDQALIIKGLVEHAQDPAYRKSDLNIGTNCPLTGVPRTRRYEFFNHELIADTIDEWPSLWNGMDWSIEITPTTRTFTSHYPRKGAFKPKYALVLGKNLSSVDVSVDGEQTANSVIVMADLGDGAAREEAISIDADALDGLILELVHVGTPGSTVDSLEAQAIRSQRRFKFPVQLPTLKAHQPLTDELLGMVQVGDVVPVIVRLGWIDLVDNYRIMEITLDPKTEEMEIKVNPEVNWAL